MAVPESALFGIEGFVQSGADQVFYPYEASILLRAIVDDTLADIFGRNKIWLASVSLDGGGDGLKTFVQMRAIMVCFDALGGI